MTSSLVSPKRPAPGRLSQTIASGGLLLGLFVAVSGGTAIATGEGSFHDWKQNNYWGHLVHGGQNDCMWMNWAIYQDGPAGFGPKLYTYGSVDGVRHLHNNQNLDFTECANQRKELPNQHIQVMQSLGHHLSWAGDNAWAWCNIGPWVASGERDGWDHDVATQFSWVNPPCMDQDDSTWYFGWHEQWHGGARVGGEAHVRALSDWLWIHW